ncbi:MAG: glycoside hydrolase [Alphaproteobacteria bacterium]
MLRFGVLIVALALSVSSEQRVYVSAPGATYEINSQTLEIQARVGNGAPIPILSALIPAGESWRHARDGDGWRWSDDHGDVIAMHADGPDLSIRISKAGESSFSAQLPTAAPTDTWIVPDGEGIAFTAGDPFWRTARGADSYREERCLDATGHLSLPAWSRIAGATATTYMLADGLQSALCLHDDGAAVQGRVSHDFSAGAEQVELLVHVGEANPLAPALAYRALLQRRGLLRTFADKQVPDLPRLYGAQHAYVYGDARQPAFLDRLHALGIERMVVVTDEGQSRNSSPEDAARAGHAGPDYLAHARALGYLAGPYELFGNAQAPQTVDDPSSDWGDVLYPSGCIRDRAGEIPAGFANRGCDLSSEALRQRTTAPNINSRYDQHVADGASTVFVDSDAFGDFKQDFSPDHPMTRARDRDNLSARLALGIEHYHFVLGSEHVHAWSHGVAHYSHGTAQAHVMWLVQGNHDRFGAWWPPQRPGIFFKPVELTPVETRAMFAPAERVPLFEAAFHDSVVSTDRWEYSLFKVIGLERMRFAHALLYGTPTMWALDGAALTRLGPWLKAAHDDFRAAHGWDAPVALTGFAWLTPDHLVQQTTFADGRTIVANFEDAPWQGLASDCVRVTWRGRAPVDLCPPDLPPPA